MGRPIDQIQDEVQTLSEKLSFLIEDVQKFTLERKNLQLELEKLYQKVDTI
jgi:regulator of replication initiation timing